MIRNREAGGWRHLFSLLLLLLVAACPLFAQTITGATSDIQTDINNASTGDTVKVNGADSATPDATMRYEGMGLTVTKTLTLRGIIPSTSGVDQETLRPDRIVIAAGAGGGPGITIDNNAAVTIEGLAFTSAEGSGVRVMPGSTVKLNRCFIFGAKTEGVSLNDATLAVIANSVIYNNTSHGIFVDSNTAAVAIGQCTIKDNQGDAVHVEGGTVDLFASLVDGNTGGLVETGGTFVSHENLVVNSGGNIEPEVDKVGSDVVPPDPIPYSTDPNEWIGKLTAEILTPTIGRTDLSASLLAFAFLDFERDFRSLLPLEIGADEVLEGAGYDWMACLVDPEIVGLGDRVTIYIELGNLNFDSDDVRIYIVPETGDPTVAAGHIEIPQGQIEYTTSKSAIAYFDFVSTFIDPLPGNSTVETLLVDGRAHVYLEKMDSPRTLYGIGFNRDRMNPDIRDEDLDFLVDTTPAQLSLVGVLTGDGRAHDFIRPVIDDPSDGDSTTFPQGWEPAAPVNGLAPASDTRLFYLSDPGVDRRNPKIFFNQDPSVSDLAFDVVALFLDAPPAPPSGQPAYDIETGGFPDDLPGTVTPAAISDTNTALYPAPQLNWPRWTLPLSEELVGPDAAAGVTYIASLANSLGFPTQLQVEWNLSGLDYDPADNGTSSFNNDWHADIQFVAYDRAGNETEKASPIETWWMAYAAAVLTSNRYNGNPIQDPVFSWDLVRGERPGPSERCIPIAKFCVYASLDSGDPLNGAWEPVSNGWSTWDARTVIDRNSVVNSSRLLGSILDDPSNQQRYLLLAVVGADEAGNVQSYNGILGSSSQVTLGNAFCAPPNGGPCATVTPGLCNQLSNGTSCNAVDFDIWFNEGQQSLIQTEVQPQYWYNATVGVDSAIDDREEFRMVQPGELDFGSSARIPLTPEALCDGRIEAAFNIQLSRQVAGVRFELYEDGRLVVAGDYFNPGRETLLTVPADLLDPTFLGWEIYPAAVFLNASPDPCGAVVERLGDDGNAPLNRRRSVDYLLTATGVLQYDNSNPPVPVVLDPTPASARFTVYVEEEEFKNEQPVKSFTRE